MTKAKEIAVVVTTANRGVFFGYISPNDSMEPHFEIRRMRNCYYWAANKDAMGFVGLATLGPAKGSKIGPSVERAILHNVTCVMEATKDAIERWENGQWTS